ncbi:hypothetical protein BDN72DRAFT_500724 [Pluteus cervinus]|uniref:Uncharacterized protein n=1 Tax=Pluteus cervinus TaxID=181527 RepID=A0ACD3AYS4_9AGAR|nr:hypothetical protein BDN72DRAFT_500724 [Pluteus cervinus]
MPTLWAKDDPKFRLTFGSLFDVAYHDQEDYLPHLTDSRKGLMTQAEVDEIVVNIFEHPSLDLSSIFQDFRLSGVLSAKDAPFIGAFLAECQDDLKLLNAKIKDTISKIAQLSLELTEASARMVQKESQVRLCEYLVSPLEHLPQDVLEQIFLACLATNVHPAPHPNRAPLQLAAVCHRWRTIALSMPFLWNGLYISAADHVELAKTWAGRCYRPSLSLELHGTQDKNPRISSSELKAVLDALPSQSPSPRRIELIGLGGALGNTLKKFVLERDHPDLEELVLRDFNASLPSIPRASSASLRRIYTHMPPESWRHSPPPSQLTVLWLTSKIHYNTLLVFLAYCPDLESLYVDLSRDGFRLEPEPQVSIELTASRLSYFGLRANYNEGGTPEEFLRRLAVPSLRVLECCQTKQISTFWLGFIDSTNSLHRLTLHVPSLASFVQLSEHATSLKELTISTRSRFMADILTSLMSMVLPSLQTLYLDLRFDEFTEWLAFEPQLTALCLAWTTLGPSDQGKRRSFGEVVIQHRYDDSMPPKSRRGPEVKKMLQSACPNLHVRIVSVPSLSRFGGSPASFTPRSRPFNHTTSHEVLEEDESINHCQRPSCT